MIEFMLNAVRRVACWLAVISTLGAACGRSEAQQLGCESGWYPSEGLRGVNGYVYAITEWDPDGPGPATKKFVIGGNFRVAGDQPAQNIAVYDAELRQFSALGPGLGNINQQVLSLAGLPDGKLFAGGSFESSGSEPVTYLASWDGTGWSDVPNAPQSSELYAMTVDPSGGLIVGGVFATVAGIPAPGVARWDGQGWSAVGPATAPGIIYSLAYLDDGRLAASGNFVGGVAIFDGANWSPMGPATQAAILTIVPLAGGGMLAAGDAMFWWNGSTWTSQPGFSGRAESSVRMNNGDVLVGGAFSIGQVQGPVARWNGAAWTSLSGLSGFGTRVNALCAATQASSGVLAGGEFDFAHNERIRSVATWDGAVWSPPCDGQPLRVAHGVESGSGELLARLRDAGRFDVICRRVDRNWIPIGQNFTGQVEVLLPLRNGTIFVAGGFDSVGSQAVRSMALWNGTQWQEFGGGTSGLIGRALEMPNGDIIVAGGVSEIGGQPIVTIARWNGVSWSQVGPSAGPSVTAMTLSDAGELLIGTPNGVRRLVGNDWQVLGQPTDRSVQTILALPDGRIIAGGGFQSVGSVPVSRVMLWDGSAWGAMSSGLHTTVKTIALGFDGTVYAGLEEPYNRGSIWAWDGSQWTRFASDVDGTVNKIVRARNGDLIVSGGFLIAGSDVAPYLARFSFGSIADFNHDGDWGTDQDIEAFFMCIAGNCCTTCGSPDFNADGDVGTDQDIEAFFRVLAGGNC